jgi:hypothetical protein
MTELQLKDAPASVQASPTVIEAKAVRRERYEVSTDVLELKNRLMIRVWLGRYLVKTTPYYSAAVFGLVVLQGFHPFGFTMDSRLLGLIVGAVIVTNGALLRVFGREVWRKSAKNP